MRVSDLTAAPWSSIVMITNSAYGRCTGLALDRRRVVTAAHCLFSARSGRQVRPGSVHVLFGYDRGRYAFHTVAESVRVPENFAFRVQASGPAAGRGASARRLGADWALISLSEPAPERFAAKAPVASRPGMRVVAAGFAQDRPEAMTVTTTCTILAERPAGLVASDCPIAHGYSGGPLLDAGTGAPVAIVTARGEVADKAVALAIPLDAIMEALTAAP